MKILLMVVMVMLVGCSGESSEPEAEAEYEDRETVFDPMVGTIDKAKQVEQQVFEQKDKMDKAPRRNGRGTVRRRYLQPAGAGIVSELRLRRASLNSACKQLLATNSHEHERASASIFVNPRCLKSGGSCYIVGPIHQHAHFRNTNMHKNRKIVTGLAFCGLVVAGFAVAQQPSGTMSFFLTSAGSGNGGDLGGLEGADAICQNLAESVDKGDLTWRAYLSTQGDDAVNARDRIGSGPWFKCQGQSNSG